MVKYAFHWLDYVIIAITMIASVGIGIYFRFSGGKQKTNAVSEKKNKKKSFTISFCLLHYTTILCSYL